MELNTIENLKHILEMETRMEDMELRLTTVLSAFEALMEATPGRPAAAGTSSRPAEPAAKKKAAAAPLTARETTLFAEAAKAGISRDQVSAVVGLLNKPLGRMAREPPAQRQLITYNSTGRVTNE